jgi:hypothetical protein
VDIRRRLAQHGKNVKDMLLAIKVKNADGAVANYLDELEQFFIDYFGGPKTKGNKNYGKILTNLRQQIRKGLPKLCLNDDRLPPEFDRAWTQQFKMSSGRVSLNSRARHHSAPFIRPVSRQLAAGNSRGIAPLNGKPSQRTRNKPELCSRRTGIATVRSPASADWQRRQPDRWSPLAAARVRRDEPDYEHAVRADARCVGNAAGAVTFMKKCALENGTNHKF